MERFYSKVVIILVTALGVHVNMDLALWQKIDRVIEWDVHSYYAYLPAIFIYDDIELVKSTYPITDNLDLFWPTETESGARVIKTTMGLSILYAPFFFLGHAWAILFDHPLNGWSPPYKVFLLFGGLCYLLIGLITTRKVLLNLGFEDIDVAITLMLIALGSNLFCYSTHSGTMSHVYSFAIIALFIHLTMRWHKDPTIALTILVGGLVGLVSLIRPTNALVAVFFIIYGVTGFADLRKKIRFYWQHATKLGLIAVMAFSIWIPQFIYWKTIVGTFFFNSYLGEHFFWSDPHLVDGLFGFRKGWFVYTPVMLIAVLGLLIKSKNLTGLRAGVAVFVMLNVYIVLSWWCWWYGGSFGQRSMVDSYAIMALPLCAVVAWSRTYRSSTRIAGAALGAFMIWLNYFQTYQFIEGSMHFDGMTSQLYFKQFGKMEKIPEFEALIEPPNYDRARERNE